ncbi:Aste57867_19267 [Aphanomyces stellatus]|uniref:Aste57867_19267 protein n=1 Tax=Aphanomyces stellatus TaxID=120398 RepID=A0A485LCS5_9STRA|nr:hypothetical protein As57867_019203 [Aphanomyces stellatus]VFT95987.1 Aste57867_19267 [Aphanomyces stellatus]
MADTADIVANEEHLDDLRRRHGADTRFVQASFQKTLRQWTKSAVERAKLETLLAYVDFCAAVLSDTPPSSVVRSAKDVARVEKYIDKIVRPYVAKHRREHSAFQPLGETATSSPAAHRDDDDKSAPIVLDGSPPTRATSMGSVDSSVVDRMLLLSMSTAAGGTVAAGSDVGSSIDAIGHVDDGDRASAYWHEHARLRATHVADVRRVHAIFDKFKRTQAAHAAPHVLAKANFMLSHVAACIAVLDDRDHVRPWAELDQVVHTIDHLIEPYLASVSDGDEYWREHAMLHRKYADDVATTHHAFTEYVAAMQTPAKASFRAQIQHILTFVTWTDDVLAETPSTHAPRPVADLELVYQYIEQYVLPYVAKYGRATSGRYQQSK